MNHDNLENFWNVSKESQVCLLKSSSFASSWSWRTNLSMRPEEHLMSIARTTVFLLTNWDLLRYGSGVLCVKKTHGRTHTTLWIVEWNGIIQLVHVPNSSCLRVTADGARALVLNWQKIVLVPLECWTCTIRHHRIVHLNFKSKCFTCRSELTGGFISIRT